MVSDLSPEDEALYISLRDRESPAHILAGPGFYAFFTYTVFTGRVPRRA